MTAMIARRLSIAALALAVAAAPAGAITPSGEDTSGAAPSGGNASDAPTAAPLAIGGFRSAEFGMDESAVRRAIFADFALAGSEVRRWSNALEQTTVLTVEVEALVPDAGPAAISYVLGRGGGLIQVTVLWGLADAGVDAADLETTAALLIDYFNARGFVSQSGAEPVVFVDGTNLLYYARGPEGGGLALSALPQPDAQAPGDPLPILRLAYGADLDNPDVFRAPAITP